VVTPITHVARLIAAKENGRDLLTLRNRHGNAPQKRFQTRPMGRAFKRCSVLKFPVSLRTAAEATQIYLDFDSFVFFLTGLIQRQAAALRKPGFPARECQSA
jgi:hypothetical protein